MRSCTDWRSPARRSTCPGKPSSARPPAACPSPASPAWKTGRESCSRTRLDSAGARARGPARAGAAGRRPRARPRVSSASSRAPARSAAPSSSAASRRRAGGHALSPSGHKCRDPRSRSRAKSGRDSPSSSARHGNRDSAFRGRSSRCPAAPATAARTAVAEKANEDEGKTRRQHGVGDNCTKTRFSQGGSRSGFPAQPCNPGRAGVPPAVEGILPDGQAGGALTFKIRRIAAAPPPGGQMPAGAGETPALPETNRTARYQAILFLATGCRRIMRARRRRGRQAQPVDSRCLSSAHSVLRSRTCVAPSRPAAPRRAAEGSSNRRSTAAAGCAGARGLDEQAVLSARDHFWAHRRGGGNRRDASAIASATTVRRLSLP